MSQINVLQVCDSIEYATTNCFHSQLSFSLHNHPKVNHSLITNNEIDKVDLSCYDQVIITMRQRYLQKHVDQVAKSLNGHRVVFYDQDPWNSFADEMPEYLDCYADFKRKLNVKHVVTSSWWANWLRSQGYDADHGDMWLLPQMCHAELSQPRNVKIGFPGQIHTDRKELFDYLSSKNVVIQFYTWLSYTQYMNSISDIETVVYRDDRFHTYRGEKLVMRNGLWGKVAEFQGRGALCIRNAGGAGAEYVKDFPGLYTYETIDQVPDILNMIEKMPLEQKREISVASAKFVRDYDGWNKFVDILLRQT